MATPDEARARARLGYLLSKIASGAPAPASGSAAAAVVAASAALVQKVAVRSEDRWSGAGAAHSRAEAIRLHAEELIELDAAAYLGFVEAVRAGNDVQAAREKTIDVPLEIARAGAEVVDLAHELEAKGNQNLRADAVAAAILAHSAMTVAAMLVQVNLTPGSGDPRVLEAGNLVRAISASAHQQVARGSKGASDRARAQSRGSGPRTRRRTSRDAP